MSYITFKRWAALATLALSFAGAVSGDTLSLEDRPALLDLAVPQAVLVTGAGAGGVSTGAPPLIGAQSALPDTSSLPGDADLNGAVTLSDYNLLAAHFNKAGGWTSGDFDGNGIVNLADYNLLAANFNKPVASPNSDPLTDPAAAVPLPSTGGTGVALLICIGVWQLSRARRSTVAKT